MKKVTTLTLRKKLGEILDKVADDKQPVTITRGNRELVTMIPSAEFDESRQRTARLGQSAKELDAARRKLSTKLSRLDTTAIIRQARDKR